MPKLSDHQSSKFVKVIFIGDSGTGKTGALTSLVKAGYNLRILDLDNGLDALRQWVGHDCPDLINNVDFETIRDNVRSTKQGPVISAKAYIRAIELMNEWSDGSKLAEGTEKDVFVLDSLTALGKSAFEWAKSMAPTAKDPRQWYFAAQQSIENIIGMLTAESFQSNLIIISHVSYKEMQDGVTKGYPNAIGSALGPTIPKYFNTMLQMESAGQGENVKRRILTTPTGIIDLKNPAPFKVDKRYEIENGMAEIFAALKAI